MYVCVCGSLNTVCMCVCGRVLIQVPQSVHRSRKRLAFFLGVECPSSNVRSMGSPLTGDKFSLSNVGSTLLTYVVKSVPDSSSLFSLMLGGFVVTGDLLKNVMMVVAWVLACSFFAGFLTFTFPGDAKSQF